MNKSLLILFLTFSFSASAQRLSVNVNKNPAMIGEQIALQYKLDAKGENFKPPNCEGLKVLQARNNGTSSNVTIINGKRTAEYTTNYMVILQATQAGPFTISPASVEVNGKIIRSQSVKLDILDCEENTSSKITNFTDQLFVKAIVSKKNIYKHEQVLVTYKLYRLIDINNLEIINMPSLKGAYIEDEPVSNKYKRDLLNCAAYQTLELKKVVLTPKKSGRLIIDPIELKCDYVSGYEKRIVTDWFGRPVEQTVPIMKEHIFKSQPINLTIKDLPKSKVDFMNLVGRFDISSNINNQEINVNDAITYKVEISGTGNIKEIKELPINFPSSFEVFEPKVEEVIRRGGVVNSKKSFEYTLIPRYKGNYTIPKFDLTFFNTKTEKYENASTHSYNINVLPGELDNEISQDKQERNQIQPIRINEDIHYIETQTKLQNKGNYKLSSNLYYILFFLPISLFILLWLLIKTRKNKSTEETQYLKARKIAQNRLVIAEKYLKKNDATSFFEEIEKVLWGYIANKFRLQTSELSKENINKYFQKSYIDQSVQDDFINIIDECEYARYSPSNEDKKMHDVLVRTKTIIIQVETKKK